LTPGSRKATIEIDRSDSSSLNQSQPSKHEGHSTGSWPSVSIDSAGQRYLRSLISSPQVLSVTNRAPTPDLVRQRPSIPARDRFISILIGQQPNKGTLLGACEWYLGFLEAQFKEVWTTLLRPTLAGLDDAASTPMEEDMTVIYRFMNIVADALRQKSRLALSDIVDELANDGLLKETDEDRSLPCQLVFGAIGWISE